MLAALVTSGIAVWTYATALNDVFVRDRTSIVATSYGGHLQFLTIIGLVLSLAQQIIALVAQLTRLRSLNALQSWLLMITAPLEVIVSVLYWPLKLYRNDLVKDARFGIRIDAALDLKCHFYPALLQFLSATTFAQRKWRAGIAGPLLLFVAVAGGYWAWVEHTFVRNGFYPYPLLSVLGTEQKAVLIGGSTLVAFLTFKIVQSIQKRVSHAL